MECLPEPYWDSKIESLVVKRDDTWIVSVSPMLFNDRIILTHTSQYPAMWTSAYCYDKGPAAALAAQAWDPYTQDRPVGYKRIAAEDTWLREHVTAERAR